MPSSLSPSPVCLGFLRVADGLMAGNGAEGQLALPHSRFVVWDRDGAALQQGGHVMLCSRTHISFRIKALIFVPLELTPGLAMCFLMP